MRDHVRMLIEDARRSGDRIGVDGAIDTPLEQLAANAVGLARVAASIHLADAARLRAASTAPDRLAPMREIAG